jgi:hypothetical protein
LSSSFRGTLNKGWLRRCDSRSLGWPMVLRVWCLIGRAGNGMGLGELAQGYRLAGIVSSKCFPAAFTQAFRGVSGIRNLAASFSRSDIGKPLFLSYSGSSCDSGEHSILQWARYPVSRKACMLAVTDQEGGMGDMGVVGNGASLPCIAWSQRRLWERPSAPMMLLMLACTTVIMQWQPGNLEQGRPGRAEHATHPISIGASHAG